MFEGTEVQVFDTYRLHRTEIVRGARGVVVAVNRRSGAVAVRFNFPFSIGGGQVATGYTFTAEEFARHVAAADTIAQAKAA